MNSVVLAVLVMIVLSVLRLHVVISLFVGAIVGGLYSGLSLVELIGAFENGLQGGAKIALTYALLGALAVCLNYSGLPQMVADKLIKKVGDGQGKDSKKILLMIVVGIVIMGLIAETLVPIHIAFIFMVIPPLIVVFNKIKLDRRLMACVISFGLVTGYMMFPIGFGGIYLNDILLNYIGKAGMDVEGVSVMKAMLIPGLGMFAGLLIAVFYTYRKPRVYADLPMVQAEDADSYKGGKRSFYTYLVAIVAVVATFIAQIFTNDSMLFGALVGILIFMLSGVVKFKKSEHVFNKGFEMMAMIGLIMISASGFAEVMQATKEIEPLVKSAVEAFGDSKAVAAFVMLLVGLLITMGIGSSFSTVPIIAAIYVPLCMQMGFSPLATVALIGAAGALGDTGSPASDSTLAPTAGLNSDGQHDHIRDTVIPTFLHFNLPLIVAGWIAAMVL